MTQPGRRNSPSLYGIFGSGDVPDVLKIQRESPGESKFLCCKFQDIIHALATDKHFPNLERRESDEQWIGWDPPDGGWMALNTDGAVKGNPGSIGAGGVIRGEKGEWIVGFSEYLGYCSATKAEIRGVLRRLKIAKEMCIPKLWIRIDSKAVVTMLNNHNSEHLEHYFLIQQCKKLLDWGGWEVRISHCFREANQVANKLAKIGTEGGLGVIIFRAPLQRLRRPCM